MSERAKLLKEIQEVGFTMDDLLLYLDTHPLDQDALKAFAQARKRRYQLTREYSGRFEPLTLCQVCPDTNNKTGTFTKYPGQKHFTWSDGLLPWDNQGGV